MSFGALIHTVAYAPGGVGEPISLAVLQRVKGQWRARKLEEPEQQEQREYIDEVEAMIGDYSRKAINEAAVSEPPKPKDVRAEKKAAKSAEKGTAN